MEFDLEHDGTRRRARVMRGTADALSITLDDGEARTVGVIARDENSVLLEIDGVRRRLRWVRRGREIHLAHRGHAGHFHWVEEDEADDRAAVGSPVVRAPMPGKVLELTVAEGDTVEAEQVVARIEAMKMEIALTAAGAGTVATVHVAVGDLVDPEAPIVTVDVAEESS